MRTGRAQGEGAWGSTGAPGDRGVTRPRSNSDGRDDAGSSNDLRGTTGEEANRCGGDVTRDCAAAGEAATAGGDPASLCARKREATGDDDTCCERGDSGWDRDRGVAVDLSGRGGRARLDEERDEGAWALGNCCRGERGRELSEVGFGVASASGPVLAAGICGREDGGGMRRRAAATRSPVDDEVPPLPS